VINNQVLIEILDKDISKGGLIIPETAKNVHSRQMGKIVAIDEGITSFKKDDKVFYDRYAGNPLSILDNERLGLERGKYYMIIDIDSLFAKIEEE